MPVLSGSAEDAPAAHHRGGEASLMAAARRAMIDSQLRVSGVTDATLLAAMDSLPREDFVPPQRRASAYVDRAHPLGPGAAGETRMLSSPLSHGLLLSEARPTAGDRALLIGGATGYLAALLAPRVASLHVVESSAGLADAAPLKPGTWIVGPLAAGAPDGAPFSLIVIDGAIEQLPAALADQLADGGRVVTGLLQRGVARLAIGHKAAGDVAFLPLADIDLAPLAEFAAPRSWRF